MVLDKTGTLTLGEFKVDFIQFGSESYHIDHDELIRKLSVDYAHLKSRVSRVGRESV
jgi:cation transport ATPase